MALKIPKGKFVIIYFAVAVLIGIIAIASSHSTPKPNPTPPVAKTSNAPQLSPKDAQLASLLKALKAKYNTVNDSYIFTATKDGGGGLNKAGEYTNGAAFCDTYNTLIKPEDKIASGGTQSGYGFNCGGSIQVYDSAASADKTIKYFQSLNGDPQLNQCKTYQGQQVCYYKQIGNVIIHLSEFYTPDQIVGLMDFLSHEVSSLKIAS